MNTLPTKRSDNDAPPADEVPTWKELRERTAEVLKDLVREGKEFERQLEPKVLPALKRLKAQIEKLIAKLEERVAERAGRNP
ncbi:MAG TPA: hypothetical protein VGQ06_06720 [Gemmatimonadales bacterium]|jgi:hypothetical protein|nr:hypothetical protein [Gemmatimonadales bacterium]